MHDSDTPPIQELLQQLRATFAEEGQRVEDYVEALQYQRYITYWDYLNLDALLSLQVPRSNQPDEMVFIIYHQITELYFKLVRQELDQITQSEPLTALDFPEKLRRIITYFELLEQSFGVMTHGMEAEQFLKLRKALMPASGFQSAQYRLIELGCTDVIQLVEPDYRASMRDRSLEEQLQHIYWKRGATDAQTGAKTLTLRQFESKYADLFQRYAWQQQDVNVRRRYPQWLAHHPEHEQPVHQQLKELDLLVNVRWPRAHLGAASRYLGGANRQKATGGTNWPQYLPPQRQHRIFFPELWTDRQQERWGLFTHPEDDAPAP